MIVGYLGTETIPFARIQYKQIQCATSNGFVQFKWHVISCTMNTTNTMPIRSITMCDNKEFGMVKRDINLIYNAEI